jgi:hypothetical protein
VRGLAYIAYLLGHPREEFHVLSLVSKVGGKQGDLAEVANGERATQSDLTVGSMGDAGEMLAQCVVRRAAGPVGARNPRSRRYFAEGQPWRTCIAAAKWASTPSGKSGEI